MLRVCQCDCWENRSSGSVGVLGVWEYGSVVCEIVLLVFECWRHGSADSLGVLVVCECWDSGSSESVRVLGVY